MSYSTFNHGDEFARSLSNNQEHAVAAAPLTQTVPEVAAPIVVPADGLGGPRLLVEVETANGTLPISLDPELARAFLLAIVMAILRLLGLRSPKVLASDIDAIAKGHLPPDVIAVIRTLVRGAVVGCAELSAERRDYAAGLLPASVGSIGSGATFRVTGIAATDEGYDLAVMTADGEESTVCLTIPPHLRIEAVESVLALAVCIVTAHSNSEARSLIRDLANGRTIGVVSRAVGFVIIGALYTSPQLSKAHKNAFMGLPSVQRLVDRFAA